MHYQFYIVLLNLGKKLKINKSIPRMKFTRGCLFKVLHHF